MAQSVEQLIRNQQVAGSNPASSSRKDEIRSRLFIFVFTRTSSVLSNLFVMKGYYKSFYGCNYLFMAINIDFNAIILYNYISVAT